LGVYRLNPYYVIANRYILQTEIKNYFSLVQLAHRDHRWRKELLNDWQYKLNHFLLEKSDL